MTSALVELRVLEGPNLYFPRAAIKLTLDLTSLDEAPDDVSAALRLAGSGCALRAPARRAPVSGSGSPPARSGVWSARSPARPAPAGSRSGCGRRLTCTRSWSPTRGATATAPRSWAGGGFGAGRPGGPGERRRARGGPGLPGRRRRGASELGAGTDDARPRVPIVAVTGTNGKTTTSRMVAHIARTAGMHVGWSSTDGIYIDGELVEAGDYSGPSGAGRVLSHDEVQLAVTETARGGILLKGVGVAYNDVSVFTNVSRRPPRAARHRHAGPARRGQGRRLPDHPSQRLGGPQRRRPAGVRHAHEHQGQAVGVLP